MFLNIYPRIGRRLALELLAHQQHRPLEHQIPSLGLHLRHLPQVLLHPFLSQFCLLPLFSCTNKATRMLLLTCWSVASWLQDKYSCHTTAGLFGASTSAFSFGGAALAAQSQQASTPSLFGGSSFSTPAFGAAPTPAFGAGSSSAFSFGGASTPAFGAYTPASSSTFGFGGAGTPAFGAAASTGGFSFGGFGGTSTGGTNLFGATGSAQQAQPLLQTQMAPATASGARRSPYVHLVEWKPLSNNQGSVKHP